MAAVIIEKFIQSQDTENMTITEDMINEARAAGRTCALAERGNSEPMPVGGTRFSSLVLS